MNFYIPWDLRVTLDLFLGGLGVGAFLTAILASLYKSQQYRALIKTGVYLAPLAVGAGLLSLISELGRPERFITTLFRVNPSSVMSWGVFLQTGFVIIAVVSAYLLLRKGETAFSEGSVALRILGAALALGVGIYHGFLLSSNVGSPLWSDGSLPLMFLFSSLLTGSAFVVIFSSFLGAPVKSGIQAETAAAREENGKNIDYGKLLLGLLIFELLAVFLWYFSLSRVGLEAQQALEVFLSGYGFIWWIGAILIGLLLPLGLLLFQLARKDRELSPGLISVVSLAILAGGFALKQIILAAGQVKFPLF